MRTKLHRMAAAMTGSLLLLTLTSSMAGTGGGNPNPGILPPGSNPLGAGYAEWAAKAAQYFLSIPTSELPSSVGQSGKVLFPPITLTAPGSNYCAFTIGVGQSLFMPLLFSIWVNAPGDPGYGLPWDIPFTDPATGKEYPTYEAWVRELMKETMDGAVVSLDIDGKPVNDIDVYRAQSVLFDADMPTDNLFGLPAGTYGPNLTDGWYLMLTPRSPGKHTFTTSIGDSFVFVYEVTVAPGH